MVFSTAGAAAPFYPPINSAQGLQFLHIFANSLFACFEINFALQESHKNNAERPCTHTSSSTPPFQILT